MNSEQKSINNKHIILLNLPKSISRYYMFILSCILIIFSSCEFRELTYFLESEINICVDWSKSGLSNNEQKYGATTLFYRIDGSSPIVVLMGDRNRKTVRLKKGEYNVVIFNRSFDDFGNISFRGETDYHTLEAYIHNTQSKWMTTSREISTTILDELAVDRMAGFEVTTDMLGNYTSDESKRNSAHLDNPYHLYFTPKRQTMDISIIIHIKGLNNIRTAIGTLSGVSESVFLASGKPSEMIVKQKFALGNPTYLPDSKIEGTLNATFSVLAFDENIRHDVLFKALLADGKTVFQEVFKEIKVNKTEECNGATHITIELVCKQTIPDVEPEGDGGFDADVEDWENEENSDIEI